jgi:hypothetical protein
MSLFEITMAPLLLGSDQQGRDRNAAEPLSSAAFTPFVHSRCLLLSMSGVDTNERNSSFSSEPPHEGWDVVRADPGKAFDLGRSALYR